MLTEVLLFFVTILFTTYLWTKYNNNYWKRHNVKFIKPLPFLGNLKEVVTLKHNLPMQMLKMYNTPGYENEPAVGIYALHKPGLLVRDLDLIKHMLIRDFNNFQNRIVKTDIRHDPLGAYSLIFASIPLWRELRTKFTAVYTSKKIREMYPLMIETCQALEQHLAAFGDSRDIVDIRNITTRFTSDLIATAAFGIQSNSLLNEKSEFFHRCSEVLNLTIERGLSFTIAFLAPFLVRPFRVKIFPKRVAQYFHESMSHVMNERAKLGTKRNDLIDLFIALQKKAKDEATTAQAAASCLPTDDFNLYVSQAASFQMAGYETAASTMTFALYELAQEPEVQEKLRAEIRLAFQEADGVISYERIHDMPYLGMVVDETLRKYPIIAFLDRQCTPEENKGYSLRPYLDYDVPAGMNMYVSLLGIQRDPKYWPNPEKFDPERFAPANRDSLNMNAYLPFGIGQRNCIGMRIGLLEVKLGLLHILRNHRVVKCSRTVECVKFEPMSPLLNFKGGIYLGVERVK